MITQMMRSATWITLLAGLFIFQSLWNVAAAFCVHESQTSVQASHFGHHQQSALCVSETHHSHVSSATTAVDQHQTDSADLKDTSLNLTQDHHDHLPSMNPILVQSVEAMTIPIEIVMNQSNQFYWLNHYQDPDLFLNSPPPEFSPLMVG